MYLIVQSDYTNNVSAILTNDLKKDFISFYKINYKITETGYIDNLSYSNRDISLIIIEIDESDKKQAIIANIEFNGNSDDDISDFISEYIEDISEVIEKFSNFRD